MRLVVSRVPAGALALLAAGVAAGALAAAVQEEHVAGLKQGEEPLHTNRLVHEKSPYLLQHAHNPVDWYPWGKEAFDRARELDRPVFLSIGYSTCHWCHVMERESFSDEEVASILNEHYVSIKVDREERPDIDKLYMAASQAVTGSGGWPLTVIMTADGKPFFIGTYFPPESWGGRPGLKDILKSLAGAWRERRGDINRAGAQIASLLEQQPGGAGAELSGEALAEAYRQYSSLYDEAHGGFGSAPKFPSVGNLVFLLRYWDRTGEKRSLAMVEGTLAAMSRGGIRDHLGGGFHRYSTDREWLVPHFEKMLYDQALLAGIYVDAYQATGKQEYAAVARETLDYVLREMRSPAGGFYSAEDADSEGEEGTFYIWTKKEVESVLGKADASWFCRFYQISDAGNFERGRSILHAGDRAASARQAKVSPEQFERMLAGARERMLAARRRRTRPFRDEKVLTAWNGLMISSLARASDVLGEPGYRKAAVEAAELVLRENTRADGRLLRRSGRETAPAGYLDDYAFLTVAFLDLYESTLDARWLAAAKKLSAGMVKLFADEEGGGFFFSGKDAERLIARRKELYDGAIPSGNSVAALAALKLGHLLSDEGLEKRGRDALKALSAQFKQAPTGYAQALVALGFSLGPVREVVIAGEAGSPATAAMLEAVKKQYMPGLVFALHEPGDAGEPLRQLIPYARHYMPLKGKATAYVCENYMCKLPVTDVAALEKLLSAK